jgi:hypothetical protein
MEFSLFFVLFLQACAFVQAPPRYNNLNHATMGTPDKGRLTAEDARDVLDLQERELALEKVSAQIQNATTTVEGYEGVLINKTSDSVNFLLDGPDKKSVNVGARTLLTLKLTPGRYRCTISRGEYVIATGIVTAGVRLHIVDTVYYKNKRYAKINEDGLADPLFEQESKDSPESKFSFYAVAE